MEVKGDGVEWEGAWHAPSDGLESGEKELFVGHGREGAVGEAAASVDGGHGGMGGAVVMKRERSGKRLMARSIMEARTGRPSAKLKWMVGGT